jgi:hypothetical protein
MDQVARLQDTAHIQNYAETPSRRFQVPLFLNYLSGNDLESITVPINCGFVNCSLQVNILTHEPSEPATLWLETVKSQMYHITLANIATYCGSLLKRNLNGRQQRSLYAKVLYTVRVNLFTQIKLLTKQA